MSATLCKGSKWTNTFHIILIQQYKQRTRRMEPGCETSWELFKGLEQFDLLLYYFLLYKVLNVTIKAK